MTGKTVRRLVGAVLVAVLGLSGCSIEKSAAPKGDVTIYASFDDVADLTEGHNVQASNVVVGSVQDITLDGYRARVEMSIVDDFRVPEGTAAVVRRTSLLGEHYVDLVLPAEFDADAGPFVADGAELAESSTQPDVEQLAEQAAIIVGSLTADDLGATVGAAAEGLGGRGPALNQLVKDAGEVAAVLAGQQDAIAGTVDALARLGEQLAPASEEFLTTLDALTDATGTLADSRDRIVATVAAVVELATAVNDTVLEPHAETLARLLSQLQPLLGTLADRVDILEDLIVDTGRFVELFPQAVHDGTVLLLAWAYIDAAALVDGVVPLADPLDAVTAFVSEAGS